jgi:hypothetical protein
MQKKITCMVLLYSEQTLCSLQLQHSEAFSFYFTCRSISRCGTTNTFKLNKILHLQLHDYEHLIIGWVRTDTLPLLKYINTLKQKGYENKDISNKSTASNGETANANCCSICCVLCSEKSYTESANPFNLWKIIIWMWLQNLCKCKVFLPEISVFYSKKRHQSMILYNSDRILIIIFKGTFYFWGMYSRPITFLYLYTFIFHLKILLLVCNNMQQKVNIIYIFSSI